MDERIRQGVSPAEIEAQRQAGWPDFHPEDYCHQCGRPNIVWHAPNELWNELVIDPEATILCPVCFAALDPDAIWRLTRAEEWR